MITLPFDTVRAKITALP